MAATLESLRERKWNAWVVCGLLLTPGSDPQYTTNSIDFFRAGVISVITNDGRNIVVRKSLPHRPRSPNKDADPPLAPTNSSPPHSSIMPTRHNNRAC